MHMHGKLVYQKLKSGHSTFGAALDEDDAHEAVFLVGNRILTRQILLCRQWLGQFVSYTLDCMGITVHKVISFTA